MTHANEPAMPVNPQVLIDAHSGGSWEMASLGLTKRELFAMHAMQGLCNAHTQDGTWAHTAKDVSFTAVEYADALLAELAKNKELQNAR